jgi:DNA-binding MurR/RpiR family transcriptional regulator
MIADQSLAPAKGSLEDAGPGANGRAGVPRVSVDAASAKLVAMFGRQHLSPKQRLIARYVTDHPQEVGFLSSTQLAVETNASQSSVTRLAISLGFRGYSDFQDRVRSLLLEAAPQLSDAVGESKVKLAIDREIRNLAGFREAMGDPTRIVELGESFAGSSPLVVLGIRASASLAEYFGYLARMVHPDVRIVTAGGSVAIDTLARSHQAGASWLLGFLLPRYPMEAFSALEFASELGYKIAIVTDAAQEPLMSIASTLITAPMDSKLVFGSQVAPALLASLLVESLCDANPTRARQCLEAFEARAEQCDFFV